MPSGIAAVVVATVPLFTLCFSRLFGIRTRKLEWVGIGIGLAGIILLKYWLEVTPKEQERRLRDRINDGRKTWKLSPMDIKSFNLWDEYTVARDAMFAATDTAWAPWFVARSEDKKTTCA